MEMSHHVKHDILIIALKVNRLDAKEANQLKQNVISLINETGKHDLIFNLEHLHFIDSSGVGVLLSILRFLNSHGGELKLANLTPQVRTILELVSMHKIFEIFDTTEAAMESFMPPTHTSHTNTKKDR